MSLRKLLLCESGWCAEEARAFATELLLYLVHDSRSMTEELRAWWLTHNSKVRQPISTVRQASLVPRVQHWPSEHNSCCFASTFRIVCITPVVNLPHCMHHPVVWCMHHTYAEKEILEHSSSFTTWQYKPTLTRFW